MNRSPLNYPLARGADADGAAELQTDVMRFMAILALCLVAIFALVQSIPLSAVPAEEAVPAPTEPAGIEPDPVPAATVAPPASAAPAPAPETGTQKPQPRAPERAVAVTRVPEPAAPPVEAAPPASPPPATPDDKSDRGFTLRFESDAALRRLVARNEIGLYAIRERDAKRMNASGSFWPASLPARYHEMDEATVPADVVAALRRSGTPGSVTWGVTLPARLSSELQRYLDRETGGDLVIGGDGTLRLERSDE